MSELHPITCIHCDAQRPPGRDPCPHCGGEPLAHKQTPAEFRDRVAKQLDEPWDDPARTGARAAAARERWGTGTIDQGKVFGTWDAPATDDDIPIPPPVGETCIWCGEEIQPGDNGRITPMLYIEHRECCLRNVLGGIGHLVNHGRYCRTVGPDAGLTRRQSSKLAWEFFQQTRGAATLEQLADWQARLEELSDA